jgi:hypothetical protein
LQAAAGETALAGRVRGLSGSPLPNVTLQIGDRLAVTDSTGRFLLSSLPSGRHQLTIQGHTASKPGKRYGTFDVLVDVRAGKTTALPYTIWLPVLDEENAVSLPVPTNREIGVTTPRVPGMEVRIPADAVLRMPAGAHHSHGLKRQELTSLSITPIPADRTPFPLPQGVNDALVFTLQLHGARVEGPKGEKRPGFRIVYPNYQNLPAGDRVEFWNYESTGVGWYLYGHGTVTADRRQVVPDPGVELQSMYCVSLMNKGDAPGLWSAPGNNTFDAAPSIWAPDCLCTTRPISYFQMSFPSSFPEPTGKAIPSIAPSAKAPPILTTCTSLAPPPPMARSYCPTVAKYVSTEFLTASPRFMNTLQRLPPFTWQP